DSVSSSAVPFGEVTAMGADHDVPLLRETDSHPTSYFEPWVSQVAYRLPALSRLRSPSIHHSDSDTVPAFLPTTCGFDHVWPPLDDLVKYSLSGLNECVTGAVGNAWYSTSSVPLGVT